MASMSGTRRVEGVKQELLNVCVFLKSWEGGHVDRQIRGQRGCCVCVCVLGRGRRDADFMHH